MGTVATTKAGSGTGRGPAFRITRVTSDSALVAALRSGREKAFEVIYDRYHSQLLSFCRHMLRSRDEAEDALQHVFLAAYKQIVESSGPINLRPWLYTVARNQCLSLIRTRGRTVEMEDYHEPHTEGLAASAQRRADLKELLNDLTQLPEDQRAALVLAELGALSHEEIAEALGCEKEKVKSLVFQARSSLIASREARSTPCSEVRQQLSLLRGGSLRRNSIRRHLKECVECRKFKLEVARQHKAMAVLLPVVPTAGLKGAVMAKAFSNAGLGSGTGAAATAIGGGGAAATGSSAATGIQVGALAAKGSGLVAGLGLKGGIAAKLIVAAALTGGGTAASVAVLSSDGGPKGGTATPALQGTSTDTSGGSGSVSGSGQTPPGSSGTESRSDDGNGNDSSDRSKGRERKERERSERGRQESGRKSHRAGKKDRRSKNIKLAKNRQKKVSAGKRLGQLKTGKQKVRPIPASSRPVATGKKPTSVPSKQPVKATPVVKTPRSVPPKKKISPPVKPTLKPVSPKAGGGGAVQGGSGGNSKGSAGP